MEKQTAQTIMVTSENRPGVLYRIAGILLRRKINVEGLEVHAINQHQARFIIKISTTKETVEKLINQIEKIIEVKEAKVI